MFDSVVIGSGIAGSIVARQLAEKGDQNVLVLERRTHIGGNCYDRVDEFGVLIHQYGPHIFHTNMDHVFDYLSRFTEWHMFGHKVVANVHDKLLPVPFNLNTLHMVYGDKAADLEAKLISEYGENSRVPIMTLRQNNDEKIREIADYVYENVFLNYTMKQWGQSPLDISPEVTARVPILISRDDRYFQDKYQGMPEKGYTQMFDNILYHQNITLMLGTEWKDYMKFKDNQFFIRDDNLEDRAFVPFHGNVIYTGALDELFDCCYGRLPYRSLRFDFEHYDTEDFQGHSVVNYTVSEDFTRITEFKHLTGQTDCEGTTIVKEYPFAYAGKKGEIPYYAISNEQNIALYQKYVNDVSSIKEFYLLGRLAEYQYYNMDIMVDKAIQLSEQIIKK